MIDGQDLCPSLHRIPCRDGKWNKRCSGRQGEMTRSVPRAELELLAEVKGRIERATSADLVKDSNSNVSQGDLADSE